jgi:glycosyltransferase involved in cell wall biosynthesis
MDHGATALFVTPGDEAGIAASIATLIDQPDLRRHLAENGTALYERLFTMDAFARSIGALYAALTPRDDAAEAAGTRRRRARDAGGAA